MLYLEASQRKIRNLTIEFNEPKLKPDHVDVLRQTLRQKAAVIGLRLLLRTCLFDHWVLGKHGGMSTTTLRLFK